MNNEGTITAGFLLLGIVLFGYVTHLQVKEEQERRRQRQRRRELSITPDEALEQVKDYLTINATHI
jgi:hypothetical protein